MLQRLDDEYKVLAIEHAQALSPYLSALESTQQQIDLEGLAFHHLNETQKYKQENERLHALAQLGITVEIVGHELEGLNLTIRHGIKMLNQSHLTGQQQQALSDLENAHHTLMDQIRFLSPLKLSGQQPLQTLKGADIAEYVMSYFGRSFENANIHVTLSDAFKCISILDLLLVFFRYLLISCITRFIGCSKANSQSGGS